MESDNIILYSILGIVIWIIIIYQIVLNASKSAEIEKQLKIQNLLIAKLLEKKGVGADDIRSILESQQKTLPK